MAPRQRLIPASIWALTVVFAIAAGVLRALNDPTLGGNAPFLQILETSTFGLGFSTIGAVIASRRPENLMGWLFCAFGGLFVVESLAEQYAQYGILTAPGSLPGTTAVAWLQQWLLWLFWPAGLALFLMLFPTGRPASARWRPFVWLALALSATMVIDSVFEAGNLGDPMRSNQYVSYSFGIPNPTGIRVIGDALALPSTIARIGSYFLIMIAAFGLVRRLIVSEGEQRQQLKWIAYVGAAILADMVAFVALDTTGHHPVGEVAFNLLLALVLVGLPAAAGIAILKYRLYDIDVVINRTFVYGALAAFITAVYVAIVVGIGALVGTGGKPNLALSILATAIVAVAFQPVREWTQRLANRVVYGQRASPYEVLAHFSEGVATTYSTDEVLPRMARIVAQGTGAAAATVWTARGDEFVPAATYPEGEPPVAAETASRSVPVGYQGDQLGELRVRKRAGEAMTPVEDKLLRDLAGQAGLLLKNVSLTADLQARLGQISAQTQELRLSRRRIVAAQDAERRRLERNIHDGAQQHLVALAVKLKLTATLARRKPEKALPALDDLQSVTREALQTLTELAGGIYPSALREHGLKTALQSQAQRMTIPVTVDAPDLSRLPLEVEAAAYFACLEALQNVAKHARATTVSIRLEDHDGDLAFSVEDDGIGLPSQMKPGSGLQNMKDRLSALGGSLTIASHPGTGTVVSGLLPAGAGPYAPMNRAGSIGAVS